MSGYVVVSSTSNTVTVVNQPTTLVIGDSAMRGPRGPQGPIGNLVFVSKNSEPAITSNLLNFVNTATITVDVIQNGMNAEIAFTAVGGAAFDQANAAYNQANSAYNTANTANVNALTAYDQANAAYTAANNRLKHQPQNIKEERSESADNRIAAIMRRRADLRGSSGDNNSVGRIVPQITSEV